MRSLKLRRQLLCWLKLHGRLHRGTRQVHRWRLYNSIWCRKCSWVGQWLGAKRATQIKLFKSSFVRQ